jgi:beta-galactosidase
MKAIIFQLLLLFTLITANAQLNKRTKINFNADWKFNLGDVANAKNEKFDDSHWRVLNLPHDWSIEGDFNEKNPATIGGGALPGGIGWYRKTFTISASENVNTIFIDFDGVYRNSEVWINGHYLGIRPYGYSSFQYNITPFLKWGKDKNVIAVKVDNSKQPNSRWYSGSGIYRNVWVEITGKVIVDHWGTYISTPQVTNQSATVVIKTKLSNSLGIIRTITAITVVYNKEGKEVGRKETSDIKVDTTKEIEQKIVVSNPSLWSVTRPYLYKAVTSVKINGNVEDEYTTPFGIRYFNFDAFKGFSLNGKPLKIRGVCDHHDLGCLGSAINYRAIQRQLEILKAMGCNGIRTSHNPPAPELLELCDKMGFIVMDEAFDMWKIKKTDYDYHLDWDAWHVRDLEDLIIRDRNHPSIFIWSVGNEINEQWNKKDSSGTIISKELVGIVKSLDTSRPVTSAFSSPYPDNPLIRSGVFDLIGYNYENANFAKFHDRFPGKKFIGTETVSALETRGHYDLLPTDSIRRWPLAWDKPLKTGNADLTVNAYDNVSTPWGSTHEETWKVMKKHDFLSGMYIWTGFDYLGEPTPYPWPARSSYFGIIDLAGFPKDVYYMYQSEWTNKDVLHILPHWNWNKGNTVDVWVYYNNADEVELFLNDKSLGIKKKTGEDLHIMWRVPFTPGTLRAISRKNGKVVLMKIMNTAGKPAQLALSADRKRINADANDLSYVTVKVTDASGNMVPDANNLIKYTITGPGIIVAVDNGSPTSLERFKAKRHTAFNGMALAVIQSKKESGKIVLTAKADGLPAATIIIQTNRNSTDALIN